MRVGLMILLVVVLAGTSAASGQTLDEILTEHYRALGGINILQAIETLRAAGTIESGGFETPFRMLRKRPRKLRIEMDMEGITDGACPMWPRAGRAPELRDPLRFLTRLLRLN